MRTNSDPKEIAATILNRSVCAVQVGACLVDNWGVFSWGWNHSGFRGLGEHAEVHCLRRANKERLARATLYVAAIRRRNQHIVTARPCEMCQWLIGRVGSTWYRNGDGEWLQL